MINSQKLKTVTTKITNSSLKVGGLGDLVLNAVTKSKAVVHKMAVRHFSHSGKKEELLDDAQISAKYIVEKVKELYKG